MPELPSSSDVSLVGGSSLAVVIGAVAVIVFGIYMGLQKGFSQHVSTSGILNVKESAKLY